MYSFINYLRAIATLLITNSHYGQIWPIDDLAAGGLLGIPREFSCHNGGNPGIGLRRILCGIFHQKGYINID